MLCTFTHVCGIINTCTLWLLLPCIFANCLTSEVFYLENLVIIECLQWLFIIGLTHKICGLLPFRCSSYLTVAMTEMQSQGSHATDRHWISMRICYNYNRQIAADTWVRQWNLKLSLSSNGIKSGACRDFLSTAEQIINLCFGVGKMFWGWCFHG